MTPEKLFHELLGLGMNWEVVESRFERERGTVCLEVAETGVAHHLKSARPGIPAKRDRGLSSRYGGAAGGSRLDRFHPPQVLPV